MVENGQVSEYKVLPIEASEIVDTNGAGDAFVGGYLAQLVRAKNGVRGAKKIDGRGCSSVGRVRLCAFSFWQIRGKNTQECIRTAQYTARVILTQPGCTYPASGPDASFL